MNGTNTGYFRCSGICSKEAKALHKEQGVFFHQFDFVFKANFLLTNK